MSTGAPDRDRRLAAPDASVAERIDVERAPAERAPATRIARVWLDRRGEAHRELDVAPHGGERRVPRVEGPLERAWAAAEDRAALARDALGRANPQIVPDPDDPSLALWTWVVEAPGARCAVLWTNPVFDHRDVGTAELARLPGSSLWTICLRLPAAMRASYRIGVWHGDGEPPWRVARGRREVLLAARDASEADDRCPDAVRGSFGELSSVAAGPAAPAELWRGRSAPARKAGSRVDALDLGAGGRSWVYAPGDRGSPTPLLVLFDGQVWMGLGLPEIIDAAIGGGAIAPLHVAMLDSGDHDSRWAGLGVPGGQVDAVLDGLLPRVRSGWNVHPCGSATAVSGQSLGGLAALWTLALGGGTVQHAIAQSASLWRFAVAEPLLAEPGWRSLELQAGTFEGDMLTDARGLEGALRGDPRIGGRAVRCSAFEAGHDWAAWRANLVGSLAGWRPGG